MFNVELQRRFWYAEARMRNWLNKLAGSRWLDASAGFLALWRLVRIGRVVAARGLDFDFNHYYVSSRLLISGRDPYTTPLAPLCQALGFVPTGDIATATNPPALLWLMAPLALLPPWKAYAVWATTEAFCLIGIIWMI